MSLHRHHTTVSGVLAGSEVEPAQTELTCVEHNPAWPLFQTKPERDETK